MRDEVAAGLRRSPKELPSKYFYDARGAALFDQITRLPEYYLTRTERALLAELMPAWLPATGARTVVELGPGSAEKTGFLLAGILGSAHNVAYVPVDLSDAYLAAIIQRVSDRWPALPVIAVRADIGEALPVPAMVPRPVLFAFLGSTIGNFSTAAAVALLRRIRSRMSGADRLLLGVDLRPGAGKPVAEVEAAYNDAQGVTAGFNRNLLRVLNRELGADFDVDAFEHEAGYDPSAHRVEMRLVARVPQRIEIPGAGWFRVEAGEAIRTEISVKYDRAVVEALFARAALRPERWAADAEGRFALALAVPRP